MMKKGGGAIDIFFNLITGIIEILANQLSKFSNFVQENSKSVLYHLIFFLSYIICFRTLFNADSEIVCFMVLIFIWILHFIFLFIVLTANINVPSLNQENRIILYSPYLFGVGWIILLFSISFMLHGYYFLYKLYDKNHLPINFGDLEEKKEKFFKYLYGSVKWMCFFYIFERIKVIFLDFFTYNQIVNTFILIFGIIFIVLSSYSIYLAYQVSNTIQQLYLPPLDSFQSFFNYFQNISNIDDEYKSIREGFYDSFSTPLPNTVPIQNMGQDINVNKMKISSTDNTEKPSKDSVDEMLYGNSNVQRMNALGLTNEVSNFNKSGLSMTTLCDEQRNMNTTSNFNTFLLNKNSKDVIYITNYNGNTNSPLLEKYKDNSSISNSLLSVMIVSNNSNYKNVDGTNIITNDNQNRGTYLIDNANNIYNIQSNGISSNNENKVTVNIHPYTSSLFNVLSIKTELNANQQGVYLLANDNNDLFFVKTFDTSSNSIEVNVLDINSQYTKFSTQVSTPFKFDGLNSCTWSVKLNYNNPIDKDYMDKYNAVDYTLNGGLGVYLLNSRRDLYFIKLVDTESKMVEIHGLSASSNYQEFCIHAITCLRITYLIDNTKPFGAKWSTFGLGYYELDSQDNLIYMKPKDNTNSLDGLIVFIISAASNYKNFLN